jgi:hypothetical protein
MDVVHLFFPIIRRHVKTMHRQELLLFRFQWFEYNFCFGWNQQTPTSSLIG